MSIKFREQRHSGNCVIPSAVEDLLIVLWGYSGIHQN